MSYDPKQKKEDTQISNIFSIKKSEVFEDDFIPGVTALLNPAKMREKEAARIAALKAAQDQIDSENLTRVKTTTPPTKSSPSLAKPNSGLPIPKMTKASPPEMKTSVTRTGVTKPGTIPIQHQRNEPSPFTPIPDQSVTNLDHDEDVSVEMTSIISPETAAAMLAQSSAQAPAGQAKTLAELGVHFELQFEMERGVFRFSRVKSHARNALSLSEQKFYFQMKLDLTLLGCTSPFSEFAKDKDFFQEEVFGLNEKSTHAQVVRSQHQSQKIFVLISGGSLVKAEAKVREFLEDTAKKAGSGEDDEFKIELAS